MDDEADLEGALARAVMPRTVRAWRGASLGEIAWSDRHDVAQPFVSSTFMRAEPERYAAQTPGDNAVEIIAPKGQSGAACVHPSPRYRYRQFELLLNVGTKLRIVSGDRTRLMLEEFVVGDAGP
ncbi:MAG: hypothetical protein ACREF0_14835 [Acetobacteraceae bacterium]